jgi:hypothetical protein
MNGAILQESLEAIWLFGACSRLPRRSTADTAHYAMRINACSATTHTTREAVSVERCAVIGVVGRQAVCSSERICRVVSLISGLFGDLAFLHYLHYLRIFTVGK